MHKKALIPALGTLAALALPFVSFAQTITNLSTAGTFFINTINNIIVPVIFALAFVVFLWGAFETFIWGANSEEVKERGKNLMLWGLIGFFIMVSIWGLVNLLTGTIQLGGTTGPNGSLPGAGVHVGS